MSASSRALTPRRPGKGSAPIMPEAGTFVLPPTASRASLLDGGSDRRFRTLVSDLLTISARMEMARTHLGRKLGITGPQYSLIVAIAHLQGSQGLSVGALAEALHVSSAFVASETNKLVRRNFLLKRTNPDDRRGVLLSIAPAGRLKLDRISEEIRWINDHFFGGLDAKAFDAMCLAATKLVQGSNAVIHALREPAKDQSTQRVAG
jgi:MarR family transcriptional regulator, organic hydroperoxide resistance regulator